MQEFRYQIVTLFQMVLLHLYALFFRHINNSVCSNFTPNFNRVFYENAASKFEGFVLPQKECYP